MRYDENFEKWAQHFQSLDSKRWERAQGEAMRRARQALTEVFFQALRWTTGRIRKIAWIILQPHPAMGKPFGVPHHVIGR